MWRGCCGLGGAAEDASGHPPSSPRPQVEDGLQPVQEIAVIQTNSIAEMEPMG